MDMSALFFNNSTLSDDEKASFVLANAIMFIYRSGLKFDNIFLFSRHDSTYDGVNIFFPMRLYYRPLSLHNMYIIHEGFLLYTVFQLNIDYYNVEMDMYKAVAGTNIAQNCNFPKENPDISVKLENVNIFFSKGKLAKNNVFDEFYFR